MLKIVEHGVKGMSFDHETYPKATGAKQEFIESEAALKLICYRGISNPYNERNTESKATDC